MRAAIGQMEIVSGDIDRNLKRGLDLIKQAKKDNCDLILLPEVWTTGFLLKKLKELSKHTDDIIKEIQSVSKGIAVCGTYVVNNEEDKGKVFNKFFAIRDKKIVFEYTKTMLFSVTGEDNYFSRGDVSQKNTFNIADTIFGVSVCYELRFPELFRRASFNNAMIHLHPAIWPTSRLDHWMILTRARAIENQCYFMCANGTKMSGRLELAGNSVIYSPWGEILENTGDSIGIRYVDIDMSQIKKARENLPSLSDSVKYFSAQ